MRVFEGLEVDIKEARCTVSLQPTFLAGSGDDFFQFKSQKRFNHEIIITST